jgi:hypothetical protein
MGHLRRPIQQPSPAEPPPRPKGQAKREHDPHSNVKTSVWSYGDSNPGPSACHALRFCLMWWYVVRFPQVSGIAASGYVAS